MKKKKKKSKKRYRVRKVRLKKNIKKTKRSKKKKKSIKIKKKIKKFKLVKKLNIPRIQLNTKKLNFVKKISFQSVINFILQPVFTAYENFREKRRIQKLRKKRPAGKRYAIKFRPIIVNAALLLGIGLCHE